MENKVPPHPPGQRADKPTPAPQARPAPAQPTVTVQDSAATATVLKLPEPDTVRINLPSGSVAYMRKAKGRDQIEAIKIAGEKSTPVEMMYATVARVTTIDGKQLLFEQMRDMDLDDITELLKVMNSFPKAGKR